MTALHHWRDSWKLVVTKCALSFPCFPPSFPLRPWHRHYSREHMEKAAHWTFKRANALIYKGAFKQQCNLDWLFSIVSISSSGHSLLLFISRETNKIKGKKFGDRVWIGDPWHWRQPDFGWPLWGLWGQGLHKVRVRRRQNGQGGGSLSPFSPFPGLPAFTI